MVSVVVALVVVTVRVVALVVVAVIGRAGRGGWCGLRRVGPSVPEIYRPVRRQTVMARNYSSVCLTRGKCVTHGRAQRSRAWAGRDDDVVWEERIRDEVAKGGALLVPVLTFGRTDGVWFRIW